MSFFETSFYVIVAKNVPKINNVSQKEKNFLKIP